VFYVATSPFVCGEDLNATSATKCTYLEAAITPGTTPSAWTPDTRAQWGCYGTDVMTPVQRTASLEIGTGKANTKIITNKNCTGTDGSPSAASIAKTYNGGGKTDWFLPSRKELDALCNEFFKGRTGSKQSQYNCMGSGDNRPVTGISGSTSWSLASGAHWSSSEVVAFVAWFQFFSIGAQSDAYKTDSFYVSPVRAF
ncbi:MAG: DUF1566 domain-containing protein, partial [Ilumatobacteraceae bacterium]|nr:DUF1566 domain-containing protein [Ilumatobacteraceae bacterium]